MRINTQIHKFLTTDPISARVLLRKATHQKTGREKSCIWPCWAVPVSPSGCACVFVLEQHKGARAELSTAQGLLHPREELLAELFPGAPLCTGQQEPHPQHMQTQSPFNPSPGLGLTREQWPRARYYHQTKHRQTQNLASKVIKHSESRKPTERKYLEGLKPSLNTCCNLLYYNLSKKTWIFEKH